MNSLLSKETCPLCSDENTWHYHEDNNRNYLQCRRCSLVFVPRRFHLDSIAEKAVYDLHLNSPEDTGYRRFLSRLADPLIERLQPARNGLDFGCGPGPVLTLMLKEAGHKMSLYDPYYFNDQSMLENKYDFITATEVIEHISRPKSELGRLFNMLNTGGILGLMTKLVKDRKAFSRWHYIHDQTHICFYSRKTFEFIAAEYKSEIEFIGADVILIKKH